MVEIVDIEVDDIGVLTKEVAHGSEQVAEEANEVVTPKLPEFVLKFVKTLTLEKDIQQKILGHLKNNVIRNPQAS